MAPPTLWLNVESVKQIDVVGLAVLAQATARASAAGTTTTIFPSPIVHNALFASGLLDRLPTDKRRAGERPEPDRMLEVEAARSVEFIAQTPRLGLRPPTWEELRLLNQWAHDAALDELVGSQLLAMCRHLGSFHPDFVTEARPRPRATLLVQPRHAAPSRRLVRSQRDPISVPVLETTIAHPRGGRIAWARATLLRAPSWSLGMSGSRRRLPYNTLAELPHAQLVHARRTLRQAGARWPALSFSSLRAGSRIRDSLSATASRRWDSEHPGAARNA